jgi:integrase/recombinase XerD
VPRDGNVNGAWVKGLKARVVPAPPVLFDAYADYMEAEYGSLDCDWVFVKLFRPAVGAPMTADSVANLTGCERGPGLPGSRRICCATATRSAIAGPGVPVEVVADLLGHAGATTTSQTYAH